MDTFVILGNVILEKFEIPETINIGGEQILKTHQYIGGNRVVDSLGRNDADIRLEGTFTDIYGMTRARYFDRMRQLGQQITFSYFQFRYKVVISAFEANIKRKNRIPYSMVLRVVEDLTAPIPFVLPTNFDEVIQGLMIKAKDLASVIQSDPINGAILSLQSAVDLVPSFNNPTIAEINSVLAPLASAKSAVSGVFNSIKIF